MFTFLGILVIALALAAAFFLFSSAKPLAALVVGLVVAGIGVAVMGLTIVDHREVAVVTRLGAYQSTITKGGLHYVNPLASVTTFDQTLQKTDIVDHTITLGSGGADGATESDSVAGGKAITDGTVRWRISKEEGVAGVQELWQTYRTFDRVTGDLVEPTAKDLLSDIIKTHPPQTVVIKHDEIRAEWEERLNTELNRFGVEVISTSIPAIDLDPVAQGAVDKIFTTQQDIQRAQNEQERARIDAETVKIREAEGALSPAANQRFCLDLVNVWDVAKNGPLPATFNCDFAGEPQEIIVNTP